jgi:hypothetical protein
MLLDMSSMFHANVPYLMPLLMAYLSAGYFFACLSEAGF